VKARGSTRERTTAAPEECRRVSVRLRRFAAPADIETRALEPASFVWLPWPRASACHPVRHLRLRRGPGQHLRCPRRPGHRRRRMRVQAPSRHGPSLRLARRHDRARPADWLPRLLRPLALLMVEVPPMRWRSPPSAPPQWCARQAAPGRRTVRGTSAGSFTSAGVGCRDGAARSRAIGRRFEEGSRITSSSAAASMAAGRRNSIGNTAAAFTLAARSTACRRNQRGRQARCCPASGAPRPLCSRVAGVDRHDRRTSRL
jgi:hypothetical protein